MFWYSRQKGQTNWQLYIWFHIGWNKNRSRCKVQPPFYHIFPPTSTSPPSPGGPARLLIFVDFSGIIPGEGGKVSSVKFAQTFRPVSGSLSKNFFHQNISTNKCPPKVYLPTLMTMICVREGSTGHIPCVHYSQVEPIPLRPLLFSDYHHHHPIPLSSSQSQFMQSSHISFQFLPAGNIKIKLDWKYHHSKCLAIFTTWNISLWAFGAIQSSKDYLVNHLCKSSGHALVDYEQKGAV